MAFWNRKCEHRWRIENKDVIPSPWELMAKDERPSPDSIEPWMFKRRVIIDYHCLICSETMRTDTEEVEEE